MMPPNAASRRPPTTPKPDTSIVRLLLAGTGWAMAWRMLSRSLGFVSLIVLARLLVPADFGVVAVATSIAASIDALSQLGVRDALVRLHDDRTEYYDTAFTIQVARGLLTGALLAVIGIFAQPWLGDARLTAILLLMAGLAVVSGFENIGMVRLARALDFRTQFIIQIAPRLLGFAVTVGVAELTHDYQALVWGMITAKVSGVTMTYVATPHRPRFGVSGWRYLLGFSFWTWAGSLAMVAWTRSDPFLLGPAIGPALLGVYLLASEIALLPLTELLEPICSTLFPGFAYASRNGAAPIASGLTIAGAIAMLTTPLSIGISATSGYLVIALLGPQWQAAQPVIAVLTWLGVASPFSYVCSSLLSAQGLVWRVFVSNGIAAVLKVAVLLLVRDTHDLRVISIASVIVVTIETILFIWQLYAAGNRELRRLGMTMVRTLMASGITTLMLTALPGTWSQVSMGRVPAILEGGAIGLLTLAVYGLLQWTLWRLFGKPEGSEHKLFTIVGDILRRVARTARPAPEA